MVTLVGGMVDVEILVTVSTWVEVVVFANREFAGPKKTSIRTRIEKT